MREDGENAVPLHPETKCSYFLSWRKDHWKHTKYRNIYPPLLTVVNCQLVSPNIKHFYPIGTFALLCSTGCPPDFRDYMSSCYHFSNKTLNWIDAEKHCQQMHHQAHLVAVESAMENDYILQYRLFNAGNKSILHPHRFSWYKSRMIL